MAILQHYFRGKRACSCFDIAIPVVEDGLRRLGVIKVDLSGLITQGSYNTKVKASGGTHAGGGTWDVKWNLVNTDEKQRAWFAAGIIPFDRRTEDAPVSKWPNHGHINIVGCPHRTASLVAQEIAAKLGRNALASNGRYRGPIVPIVPFKTAVERYWATAGAINDAVASIKQPFESMIPRSYTAKPWPVIAEDRVRGPQTMDRLRMQLNLKTTKSAAWSHWDVAALLVWLNEPYIGKGVLTPLAIRKLQYRVGVTQDAKWGPVTTLGLQKYLNKYR